LVTGSVLSREKIARTIAEANESADTGARTVEGVLDLERVLARLWLRETAGGRGILGTQECQKAGSRRGFEGSCIAKALNP